MPEITQKCHAQCFANMIRIANDSVCQSLKEGKLIVLVTVYALLVSHKDLNNCVPMKYYCNFKDSSKCWRDIKVGICGNSAELLHCILLCEN